MNICVTYSVRYIISKPFVHKMTILAFRKMRSKDSDGRKKSYENRENDYYASSAW